MPAGSTSPPSSVGVRFFQFFLLLGLLCFLRGVDAVAPPRTLTGTLCYIYFPSGSSTTSVWHAHHALDQFLPSIRDSESQNHKHTSANNNITFTLKVLEDDGNKNPSSAVASILDAKNQDCDMLLGPVASIYATATAPVATIPIISESATSTELSNRLTNPQYEYFSRVTMSDADAGRALTATMKFLNMNEINIICLNDAFGRSLANVVRQSFTGKVLHDVCWPHTISKADMLQSLRTMVSQSSSKVIVLAMSPKEDFMEVLEDALIQVGVTGRKDGGGYTFFLSDMLFNDVGGRDIFQGSFCALQGLDQAAAAAYEEKWKAYNKSALEMYTKPKAEGGVGLIPYRNKNIFTPYSGLIVDAVHLAVEALTWVLELDPQLQSRDSKGERLLQYLRRTSVKGLSGNVVLSAENGDRVVGTMDVFNVDKDLNKVVVGHYDPSRPALDEFYLSKSSSSWYIAGLGFVADPSEVTSSHWTRSASADDNGAQKQDRIIMGIIALSILLLLMFLTATVLYVLRGHSRDALRNLVSKRSFWLVVGGLCAYVGDVVSDIAGFYVVVERGSPLSFSILYGILTVSAFFVSGFECYKLIRLFRIHCIHAYSEDGVPAHLLVYWNLNIAQTAVLSLVVEDLPMLALATAALIQETNVVLLLSLTVSTVSAGFKIGKVGMVIRSILQPNFNVTIDDEGNLLENSDTNVLMSDGSMSRKNSLSRKGTLTRILSTARGPPNETSFTNMNKSLGSTETSNNTSALLQSRKTLVSAAPPAAASRRNGSQNTECLMMSMNLADIDIVDEHIPEVFKQAVRDRLDPERLDQLEHQRVEISYQLSDFLRLDLLEFFVVAKPILADYAGYKEDEEDVLDAAAALSLRSVADEGLADDGVLHSQSRAFELFDPELLGGGI